jgi:hypothetical protein
MRTVAFSVGSEPKFGSAVIRPITRNGVSGSLVFVGHRTPRRGYTPRYETKRIYRCQPLEMFFASMDPVVSVSVMILIQKFVRELNEPPIIIE